MSEHLERAARELVLSIHPTRDEGAISVKARVIAQALAEAEQRGWERGRDAAAEEMRDREDLFGSRAVEKRAVASIRALKPPEGGENG